MWYILAQLSIDYWIGVGAFIEDTSAVTIVVGSKL